MKPFLSWLALSWLATALAADGASLYTQHCAGCHQAQAQGIPGVFPPLANNPRTLDQQYVAKVILEGLSGPLEVNGQTYNGVMPGMPQVGQEGAKAIAAFLAQGPANTSVTAPQITATPTTNPAQTAALAEQGRALFLGQQSLANGGAPCMACHTAGQVGVLGGGSLGKDLTDLHTRLGDAGITGVLSSIAFPVMRESYKNKALTEGEIQALVAFFAEAAKQPVHSPAVYSGRLFYIAAAGALLLFVLMFLLWINRRPSLAERLRRRKA